MRAFARDPKAVEASAFATIFSRTHFGRRGAEAGGGRGDWAAAESARFNHDFSRIPSHAPATGPRWDYHERMRAGGREQLPQPKIRVNGLSAANGSRLASRDKSELDKSETPSLEDQDQTASLKSLTTTTTGVDITVDGVGLTSSPDYPDGFRWTQTIVTNAEKGGPLLTTPVNYTDPKPNDDTKPFYWTDAEEARYAGTFKDAPSRKPRAGGTVEWDAILSLVGVNGKTVTRFDSMGYGFSVSSTGAISLHAAMTPGDVTDHLSTLSGDFPGWTFV